MLVNDAQRAAASRVVVRPNESSRARLWTKWPRGRLVTGIGGAEQRDRQTASQEIKHEPQEERPFLKPDGQSTEQQDDPDDDADGQFYDVSPLLTIFNSGGCRVWSSGAW
jgi:hypothetical protein